MREIRTEKIENLLILHQYDKKGHPIKSVFLKYIPVAQFKVNDPQERKLAAIELVERDLCNQKTAGEICSFHRNTVFKLLRTKALLGLEAVLKDNRGLKEPYKYIGEIRSHIKKLIRKYPDWTDQAIAEKAALELSMEISRSAVARIRTEKQDREKAKGILKKQELIDMAKVAETIDEERFDSRQLRLNFEKDPELKRRSEEFSKEPLPKAERQSEKYFVERLQKGERCNFAGGLMHRLFLEEIGFEEILSPFALNRGATYGGIEILGTLFHSVHQGISSIEALKLVNASELGVLIGRNRSPEKETVREHMGQMAKHYLSDKLIDRFAERLLELGKIDEEVFFVDGHFLPYYGLKVIAKGFYTVRRLAMRGNELYAVTDLRGKPLFFITESNEIDFRPIISRCAGKLRELGISRPILVFDRGGYGIHFFKELGDHADFVSWAKYVGDKSLRRIPEESFSVGVFSEDSKYMVAEELRTVTESIQTAEKEGRKAPTSMELRLVVLKDVETGKRIGIYTNNRSKALHDIAYYMLQRWGDSENFFKEMMDRFNLNYHPGYDIQELEKQPLVENPDIALTQKAIYALKKEVESLEKEVLITEAKMIKRSDKRLSKRLSKLRSSVEEKKTDIIQFERKLSTLPDKVSIVDILQGKPMNRCDLEKKKLYDLMQFMAFHSRERLVEIFRNAYHDPRDIKKVLDMATSRAGYLKLIGQTLVVILDWVENKKHREAVDRLCWSINQIGIRLGGRLNVKLFFHLSRIPHHGSGNAPAGVPCFS
jgi:hypothetical protein